MKFSIFIKLLLLILPLVCLPIATVGYYAVRASVEQVNRLVRQEQMLNLEATAGKINDIMENCRLDLDTLSRLPVIEDYYLARSFRLEAETEFHYENILRIFTDFIRRTPYYSRLLYQEPGGETTVVAGREDHSPESSGRAVQLGLKRPDDKGTGDIIFSPIIHLPGRRGYVMLAAKPFLTGWKEQAGRVVIELDFNHITEVVRAIHVGERGYAFLVDEQGWSIVHPQFEPYEFGFRNVADESLRELTNEMINGEAGWKTYQFQGEEKMAAFAPIPAMNWSLAVTIPSSVIGQEARAIQTKVIQVTLVALVLAVAGVSILSYNLLRPVRRLVNATNRIADGDMSHEIKVSSNDELGDLTESFNRMVRNLSRVQNELVRSEKLISLGRLSAGVAHEVRNPLNAMKGAIVYMKRRRPDDPLIEEYTGLVLDEIDRLSRFVTEFLYFAKQSPPLTVPTNLNRLILATLHRFQELAEEKEITFASNLDFKLPEMELDPHQIERVLINLILNAVEAMPDGGTITFSTLFLKADTNGKKTGRVRIVVHDNGLGIPEDRLPYIFDPFFTSKETGTGLGLPLSLGIIEYHGGTINLSSREGRGATVTLELPMREGVS